MKSQIIFAIFLLTGVLSQNDWVNLASLPVIGQYAHNYSHNIFSGYLNNGAGDQLHYVFLESQNNPKTDPLILWLNGGPGCSSMLGWLYEHGPFPFKEGETYTQWNNYSWNQAANMIYMESPACVGLSTCNNPDQTFNDSNVAAANLAALTQWFQRYPNFTTNDFYVAGESYGGIYVPYLSWYIDQSNTAKTTNINLKGFMVGNGVTNYAYDTLGSMPDYFFQHGIFPPTIYDEIIYETCEDPYGSDCENFLFGSAYVQNLNIYDLYRWCYNENETTSVQNGPLKFHKNYARFLDLLKNDKAGPLPGMTAPCIDGLGAYTWLNNPAVRTGLHIPSSINYNWAMCVEINYDINQALGSYFIYEQLVPLNKYKIMFFSGDADASVSILGTQRWIAELVDTYSIPTEVPYKVWTLPGDTTPNATQTAGWVTYYQGLEFVQVKGAGHMVPQWRRPEAYKMFTYFLNNTILS
jgi:cathepsin A (carboxypeptidase C)